MGSRVLPSTSTSINPGNVIIGENQLTSSSKIRINFIDLCFLCNQHYCSSTTFSEDGLNTSIDQNEVDKVLNVFLADKDECYMCLQLCSSCKSLCENLLKSRQKVSQLIDSITNLLLQNSRFTLIHSKDVIVSKLFSDPSSPDASPDYTYPEFTKTENNLVESNENNGVESVYLQNQNLELAPLVNCQPSQNVERETEELDRQIAELEFQFHMDKLIMDRNELLANYDCDHNSSSSAYSLPSIVSLDSSSSTQKDTIRNIMNVHISALESSSISNGHKSSPDSKKSSLLPLPTPYSDSHANQLSSINMIANATNDELELCFSNKIQLKGSTSLKKNVKEEESKLEINFRLPSIPQLPRIKMSPRKESPVIKKVEGNEGKKKVKSKRERRDEKKDKEKCSLVKKKSAKILKSSTSETETSKGIVENAPCNSEIDEKAQVKLKKFICEVCGAIYRQKRSLKIHLALHRGEVKFKCDHCDKYFTQKTGLTRHVDAIHNLAQNYKCKECNRSFRYHSSFNSHKKSHHDKNLERKFKCNYDSCSNSFFTGYHLKRHLRTHTGVKPYSCQICSKSFTEKYNLDSHAKSHNENISIQPNPPQPPTTTPISV